MAAHHSYRSVEKGRLEKRSQEIQRAGFTMAFEVFLQADHFEQRCCFVKVVSENSVQSLSAFAPILYLRHDNAAESNYMDNLPYQVTRAGLTIRSTRTLPLRVNVLDNRSDFHFSHHRSAVGSAG